LCLIPALYWGGVVLFALWNARSYASEVPQLLRYVVAPGLLAVMFLAVGLFGSRVNRVRLGGTGIALLLALFAYEVRLEGQYVSALLGLTNMPSRALMRKMGVAHAMPPAHTLAKLNREMGVQQLDAAVLSGMPWERVLLCSHDGRAIIYQADRYGFRNPDTVYNRPVDRLMVGDSFVEGICLPDGMDLVSQVRALGTNVVGIGIRGAGPLLELAMLGRFGPVIRPRQVVIVFYEGNDWDNLGHEVKYPWLRGALGPNARFGSATMSEMAKDKAEAIIANWTVDDRSRASLALARANLLRNSLALHQTWTQLGLGYPKAAREMPVYDRIVMRSKALVTAWGGQLVILYVPQTSRFIGLFPHGFVYDRIRDRVAMAASRNKVPMIDLSPHFAAAPDPLALFASDGHLSVRGARVAATALTAL
jgi:hypothetical protein